MKTQAILAAVAMLAACHASAQSASGAGSYDWGQSQVQKMYQSPYARSSDALAATAERKRLTEARGEHEDRDTPDRPTSAGATKKSGGGKLACLGMGSTLNGKGCTTGAAQGLSLVRHQGLQQQGLSSR